MRFPSTLLAQIAGKSDPKDVEREVQKADLDLLTKINEIAGGNTLTLSSTGYREKVGDNYDLIAISTGATTQTVTLAVGKQVLGRQRTYAKTDSGAGEVKLSCTGTDVIYYAGGTATAMYVGLQYQSATLLAISGGYLLIGGVTQPVSGEPSFGTLHEIAYANRNSTPLVNTSTNTAGVWSAAVTIANAPPGARIAWCMATITKAALSPALAVEAASGVTLSDVTVGSNIFLYQFCSPDSAGGQSWRLMPIPIDASKQFKWVTTSTNSSVTILAPVFYTI